MNLAGDPLSRSIPDTDLDPMTTSNPINISCIECEPA